jgi:hypothetical protein
MLLSVLEKSNIAVLGKYKEKKRPIKPLFSFFVAGTGLEPVTFGL